MEQLCERCGRPLSVAPGAEDDRVCSCERGAGAGALPPAKGNVEVDPWSVPPPDGGYEPFDIELDPTGPQQPGPAAADGAGTGARPAPDLAAAIAEAPAPEREARAPAPRPRSRAVLAFAAAAIAILLVASAWLVLGRGGGGGASSGRPSVRVTVTTQEVPWTSAPPLAPIDPSYVERRRPAEPVLPAAAPRSGAGRGGTARGAAPATATPTATPTPTPTAAAAATPIPAPEPIAEAPPEPAPAPAAAAPAEIPLPPPPVIPAKHEPPAPSASARPASLQTRTCVSDALRVPEAVEGSLPPEVVLSVQVGDDGRPADVSFPAGLEPRLRSAILAAVRTCRFAPAADAAGRPAPGRATMKLRFEP